MAQADPEKIEAARAFAEKEVLEFLSNEHQGGQTGHGPLAYFFWWHYNLSWSEGPRGPCIRVSDQAAAALCRAALDNMDAHRIVREIIASRILNGMTLSNDLKDFASLLLVDKLPKPKTKPGTKVSERFERDMFIIWTLSEIKERFGIHLTQNDYRGQELPPNGMAILAACFASAGRHEVTARAIKDVWLDKKKRRMSKSLNDALAGYKRASVNSLTDMLGSVGN